jgi:hypothetical protein
MPVSVELRKLFNGNVENTPGVKSTIRFPASEFPGIDIESLARQVRSVRSAVLGGDAAGVAVFSITSISNSIVIEVTPEAWQQVKDHVASLE